MAFDTNKFNAMLNEIMPFIAQDVMRKRYLREQIQGWTEYDRAKSEQEMRRQRELQKLYLENAAKEIFLKKLAEVTGGEAEGKPMPSAYYVDAWNRYVPGTEAPGVPENYPEMMEDFYNKVQQLIIAQKAQDPEKATDEAILGMIKGRGIPEAIEMMENIMKGYTGKQEMELDRAKLEEMAKTRGVREAELEEQKRRREYEEKIPTGGTTKGGADQKDAIKKLDKLYKDRYSLIEDLMTEELGPKEKSSKEAMVFSLNRQISNLKKSTGIQTEEDETYRKGAEWLKNNGFSKQDLLTNQDLINKLKNAGIIPLIMLEYF